MIALTTSFNVCIDPYNEDLQADQLTLSISVHRVVVFECVEVMARGRASRASKKDLPSVAADEPPRRHPAPSRGPRTPLVASGGRAAARTQAP